MPNNERLLAPVPSSTCSPATIAGTQAWSANYNVSCWLRGRSANVADLSLVLRYRDAAGEQEVIVDRARVARDAGVLLSGCVTVQAKGRIAEMTVWLLSAVDGCDVFVDELYVQRIGDKASPSLVAVR